MQNLKWTKEKRKESAVNHYGVLCYLRLIFRESYLMILIEKFRKIFKHWYDIIDHANERTDQSETSGIFHQNWMNQQGKQN